MAQTEKLISRRNTLISGSLACLGLVASGMASIESGLHLKKEKNKNIDQQVYETIEEFNMFAGELNYLRTKDNAYRSLYSAFAPFCSIFKFTQKARQQPIEQKTKSKRLNKRQFLKATAVLPVGFALGLAAGNKLENPQTNTSKQIVSYVDRVASSLDNWLKEVKAVTEKDLSSLYDPANGESDPELDKLIHDQLQIKPLEVKPIFNDGVEDNHIVLNNNDIDENTIVIHIPGAAGVCIDGRNGRRSEIEFFLPWFKQYYIAKGHTETQAENESAELLKAVLSHKDIPVKSLRLGLQIEEMIKRNILVLPWEILPHMNPLSMALLVVSFIKNLPSGKKVILTGHSLGGMVVRSFLKMYQEGYFDNALGNKKIITTINFNEAYPGDDLFNLLNTASESYILMKRTTDPEETYDLASLLNQNNPVMEIFKRMITDGNFMFGDPNYFTKVDAVKIKERGTEVISIRSKQDLFATNAAISGAYDITFELNTNDGNIKRVNIGLGKPQTLVIPTPLRAIDNQGGPAHYPYPELSKIIINR